MEKDVDDSIRDLVIEAAKEGLIPAIIRIDQYSLEEETTEGSVGPATPMTRIVRQPTNSDRRRLAAWDSSGENVLEGMIDWVAQGIDELIKGEDEGTDTTGINRYFWALANMLVLVRALS